MQKHLRSNRDREEIRVFRRFAGVSHLGIVDDSIEKRVPPEPDILCRLENGAHIAFELVEICHPQNARFFGSAPLIARALERTYRDLPQESLNRFTERFANRALSFKFVSRASLNRIRQILPQLFVELIDQPEDDGEFRTFSGTVRKGVVSVQLRGRVECPGRPAFNVGGQFQPDDVVIESVRPKLNRKYKTAHPAELLAHFGGSAWGRSTGWKPALGKLLESLGTGPFRRVWVLGWGDIDFVYPNRLLG